MQTSWCLFQRLSFGVGCPVVGWSVFSFCFEGVVFRDAEGFAIFFLHAVFFDIVVLLFSDFGVMPGAQARFQISPIRQVDQPV